MSLFLKIKVSVIYKIRFRYGKLSFAFWDLITKIIITNKRDMTKRNILFVWVPVWGEKHINWFFNYTLSSLLTANNLPQVAENIKIIICFYTKDMDKSSIDKRMTSSLCPYEYSITTESFFQDKARDMMSNYMIHILDRSINNNGLILICQPDLLFSDGSINNLVELSNFKGVSISVPHPRVSIESLIKNNVDIKNLTRKKLEFVSVALQNKHDALFYADETAENNSTNMGVSTRKISNGEVVIHNLPAVYLCNPIHDDLIFFKRRCTFNIIDKTWTHMLFRQSRLKIVTSSDVVFLIELTEDKIKAKIKTNSAYNDFYTGYRPFVEFTNGVISFWRTK